MKQAVLKIAALALALTGPLGRAQDVAAAQAGDPVPAINIVLVHGAFADGSGWEGVYRILTKHKYNVTIVQNSTSSLAADVTATQNVLANLKGPVVLVGHSYGGEVITQAGNDPKVKWLVYVNAFAPDFGESLQSLSAEKLFLPAPPFFSPNEGFVLLQPAQFPEAFAADVDRHQAEFLAASQVPLGAQTLSDQVTTVAWKTKPSYYIVSTGDHMIPPDAERMMAARVMDAQAASLKFEIKGASHAVYISRPKKVAKVIEQAASQVASMIEQ